MAPSGQSTTIAHPSPAWKEQLSLWRGTTFCVPHPDRGQKAQQKQRCSSSKPVTTVQVGLGSKGHSLQFLRQSKSLSMYFWPGSVPVLLHNSLYLNQPDTAEYKSLLDALQAVGNSWATAWQRAKAVGSLLNNI